MAIYVMYLTKQFSYYIIEENIPIYLQVSDKTTVCSIASNDFLGLQLTF